MAGIFNTETSYLSLESYYPDYPKNNFTFNFNTVNVDKEYNKGYSLGWTDGFVEETDIPIWEEKNNNNYLNNNYTRKNIKTLHKPDTIGNVINMLGQCKYFTALLNGNPNFIKFLNEKNYVHGNTLFIPIDLNFYKLEKFYDENVPDSTRKENKNIYKSDMGIYVKASKFLEILKTHIIKQSIYPEQLIERSLRIKPLSEQNEFFMKNMKIYNRYEARDFDILSTPSKIKDPKMIDILQAIECSNGFIYIISEPIIPSVFYL